MMLCRSPIQHKSPSTFRSPLNFLLALLLSVVVINQEMCRPIQASRVSERCSRYEGGIRLSRDVFDKCTCDMKVVILNLRSFAQDTRARLEDRLRDHVCQQYLKLPESLVLDASMVGGIFEDPDQYSSDNQMSYDVQPSFYNNRRYRRRRFKRQVRLGVPTNELFESAIAHVSPDGFHQYVILGSTVRFQCWGRLDDWVDGSYVARMVWTHFNGEPITSPQISIDAVAGTLTIPTVQLSDVDIYNCTVHKRTDEGIMETQTYSHQLSVISEPIFWLQMSVEYEASQCNHEEVKLIRNKLSSWVQVLICPQCEVHNDTVGCSSSRRNSDFPSIYNIHLVVSAIGLEIQMEKSLADRFYACPVSCLELMQSKIMQHVRDNTMKVFRLPIEIRGSNDRKLIHNVVPNSFEMELLMGCLAGFFLQYKLCFPCPPGSFSSYGSTECFPCPMAHYQPQPASAECIACDEGLDTVSTGSISHTQCYRQMLAETAKQTKEVINDPSNHLPIIIGASCGGLALIIVIILIIICVACPNSGCGQCLRKFCCCCCKSSTTPYEPLPVEDMDDKKGSRDDTKGQRRNSTSNSKPKTAAKSKDADRQVGRSKGNTAKAKSSAVPQKNQGGERPTVKMKRPPTPPPMPPTRNY